MHLPSQSVIPAAGPDEFTTTERVDAGDKVTGVNSAEADADDDADVDNECKRGGSGESAARDAALDSLESDGDECCSISNTVGIVAAARGVPMFIVEATAAAASAAVVRVALAAALIPVAEAGADAASEAVMSTLPLSAAAAAAGATAVSVLMVLAELV
jgi:hypothetical protein